MLKTALLLVLLPITLATVSHTLPLAKPRQGRLPAPKPNRTATRNYGARADSLNGIPGHAFGEPRSNFPELVTKGYRDLDGYMYYTAKPDQETGWFGKNAEHVSTVYRFYEDRFASFDASAYGPDRPLLAGEAAYLFGKGQPPAPKNLAYGESALHWEGQRVRVQLLDGHNECRLIVSSKLVAAQKAADEAARKKAEAATRAAKLRADNAPAAH